MYVSSIYLYDLTVVCMMKLMCFMYALIDEYKDHLIVRPGVRFPKYKARM